MMNQEEFVNLADLSRQRWTIKEIAAETVPAQDTFPHGMAKRLARSRRTN